MPNQLNEKQLWDAIKFEIEAQMLDLNIDDGRDELDEQPQDSPILRAGIAAANIKTVLLKAGYKIVKDE